MRLSALPASVLLAALAGAPGCLGWEQRVVLSPDGSGTWSVHASYDAGAADALRKRVREHAAALAPGSASAAPEVDPIAPGWLHAQARGLEGLTLDPVCEQTNEGLLRRATLRARFQSLEVAARGGLFHGAEVAFERRPKKRWRFTLRPPWLPTGPGADDAMGGVPAARLRPAFAPDLAALSMALVITFPAPVVATNGALSEDRRTVTYKARGDDAAGQALEVELELPEEEAWPTFRHRPDLGELARRLVLAAPPPPAPIPAPEEATPR